MDTLEQGYVGGIIPTEPDNTGNDKDFMGRPTKASIDLLQSETIFGKYGYKQAFMSHYDKIADMNFGPKWDEYDVDENRIDPITRQPYSEEAFENNFWAVKEEAMLQAKANPVTDEQRASLENESDFVKLQMNDDGAFDSSFNFERRRAYLRELERQQKNIQNNADIMDYGALFLASIGDVDSVLTMGVGSLVSATVKGKKILKKAADNPIKTGIVSGAVGSGVNEWILNSISGTSQDNDILWATGLGAAFGGTLGWGFSRLNNAVEGNKVVGPDGSKMTRGEALQQEIARVNAEIDELTKLQETNLKVHNEAQVTADELGQGTTRYAKKIADLQAQKANHERLLAEGIEIEHSKYSYELIKEHDTAVKKLDEEISSHTVTAQRLETKIAEKEARIAARKETEKFNKDINTINGKITKGKETIKALKKQLTEAKAALSKAVKNPGVSEKLKLNLAEKKEAIEAKLNKASDDLKDHTQKREGMKADKPTYTRPTKEPISTKEEKAKLAETNKAIKAAEKAKKAKKSQLDKDLGEIDKMASEASQVSKNTLKDIQDKLRAAGYKYQDLIKQKAEAEDRLAKLKEGILPTDTYKQEIITAKEKLEQDLEDYVNNPVNMDRLMDNPIFNMSPNFLKKAIISPIERLYNSENRALASLATLLAPPVVAKDAFVNNLNAKTYIQNARQEVGATLQGIDADFRAYVKEGGKDYTLSTWLREVSKQRAKLIGKQQRKVVENTPNMEKGSKTLEEILEEQHKTTKYTFEHDNVHLQRSMERMESYYVSQREKGANLQLTGMINTRQGGYVQQLYSEDVARAMGEEAFVDFVFKAQKRYAIDHGLDISDNDLIERAKTAYYHALDENQRYEKSFNQFKLQAGTQANKQRSILMYADDAAEVINHNLAANMMTYGRAMGGKFALKKFLGIEQKGQLVNVIRELGPVNQKEMESLNAIVDTIAGYREIMKYNETWEKVLHGASSISSMLHTMNFGLSAITEITTSIANTGFKNTVTSLIPGYDKTIKLYKQGAMSEDDFKHMSILADTGNHKFGVEINRFEMGEKIGKHGIFQDTMDNVVHKEALYSGLNLFTDWFKVSSQMSSQKFIVDLAGDISNISKADRRRLNQIGINDEHLSEIQAHAYKDGKFVGMNRDKWSDELNDVVDRASMTQAYNTILHPDGFTLPMIMSDGSNQLSKVLNHSILKFMKFPIASYEALLLQGMSTFDAKIVVGTALNMAMWSQILIAKDAMNNWGEGSKPKYDLDTEEGWHKLLVQTLQVMSVTSSLVGGYNLVEPFVPGLPSMSGYDKSIGDNVVHSDVTRALEGDIPLSIYGIQLMKTLENLDIVDRTFQPKMSWESSYELSGD